MSISSDITAEKPHKPHHFDNITYITLKYNYLYQKQMIPVPTLAFSQCPVVPCTILRYRCTLSEHNDNKTCCSSHHDRGLTLSLRDDIRPVRYHHSVSYQSSVVQFICWMRLSSSRSSLESRSVFACSALTSTELSIFISVLDAR